MQSKVKIGANGDKLCLKELKPMSCHANEILTERLFVSEIQGAFLETGWVGKGGSFVINLVTL